MDDRCSLGRNVNRRRLYGHFLDVAGAKSSILANHVQLLYNFLERCENENLYNRTVKQ